jgi:hypothetical protein
MRTATLFRSQYYSKGTKILYNQIFDGDFKIKLKILKISCSSFLIIGMDTKK